MTPLVSRRALLGLLGSVPVLLWVDSGHAEPERSARERTLVSVFLRGAMDGLSLIVPYSEPNYYEFRPNIAVARPGRDGGALDLDGRFGLHPRFAALLPAFRAKELALITCVGSPHPTRSHFEAQNYMEAGALSPSGARAGGWLGRALSSLPARELGLLPAVALSEKTPLALRGFRPTVSTRNLGDLKVKARGAVLDGFEALYAAENDFTAWSARRALEVSRRLAPIIERPKPPENGARYPKSGSAFREIASLIKANVGLRAAWIDVGGWDTHRNQGNGERGELAGRFEALARSLAAFRADLGARFANVTVVVMSEFGRTVRQNGAAGTDHGHGGALLVLGGRVNGGKVYGAFEGLSLEHLHEERDLPVTTDFRDVLAELCERELGVTNPAQVFSDYPLRSERRLGLLST